MIRILSIAVISLAALTPATFALAERPHVVWIIADDLSPELGCYGYDAVATPNIDRLAERGARFTNAFATAPVCSSSRSAFITGVFQTTTATHQHRTIKKSALAAPFEPIKVGFPRRRPTGCATSSARATLGTVAQ